MPYDGFFKVKRSSHRVRINQWDNGTRLADLFQIKKVATDAPVFFQGENWADTPSVSISKRAVILRRLRMKAAQLYQFDTSLQGAEWLVYGDVREPTIEKPTDVIVRIGGAGVCGTDLDLIKGIWCDYLRIELPMILGHENAGWVEEVGLFSGIRKDWRPGDCSYPWAVKTLVVPDALTRYSRQAPRRVSRIPIAMGGFAEYMLAEESTLIRLPTHLSPMDIAPLADAGLTAYSAVRRASEHLAPGNYNTGPGSRRTGTRGNTGFKGHSVQPKSLR